jgi:hypothetical protein
MKADRLVGSRRALFHHRIAGARNDPQPEPLAADGRWRHEVDHGYCLLCACPRSVNTT